VAVATSFIAHYNRSLWYFDPIGAIAISIYITVSWVATGKEQVDRLVGLRTTYNEEHNNYYYVDSIAYLYICISCVEADKDFIARVHSIADGHHPQMKSDIVRAYHFGEHFLVYLYANTVYGYVS
jgi:hypothetical protein